MENEFTAAGFHRPTLEVVIAKIERVAAQARVEQVGRSSTPENEDLMLSVIDLLDTTAQVIRMDMLDE